MQTAISSKIDLIPTGDNPNANFLTAELFIIPMQSELQKASNVQYISIPEAEIEPSQDKITYTWDKLTDSVTLGVTADIKSSGEIIQIKDKIQFPIINLDFNYNDYLQATEFIDINENIRNKANELVTGEDDLYEAVFKIADWVNNNVNYNLSTLTAEVVQKSSWVMQHKEGVCDEITNLFISMVRSVGVPARFVSGVAYTNIEDNWGNHGWAEVYFPGYGWIPFDVTYKQYGWIDPSHISLNKNVDSSSPSLTLSGSMHNSKFSDTKLEIKTNLVSKSDIKQELVTTDIELLNDQVGPGSYVPIKINVENLQPYYVPVQFRVTKAPELTEDNIKIILLKPNQKESVFWTVKIPSEIKSNYLYTTVFEVINSFGSIESTKINYAEDYNIISLEQANQVIDSYKIAEQQSSSEEISVNCKPEKSYYYTYEKASLLCTIKNTGNVILGDLDVCLENNCNAIDLYIAESREMKFENVDANKELEVKISGNSIDYKNKFTIKSLSDPHLRVSNLKYPDLIFYNGIADLEFTLSSEAPVKNLKFTLNGHSFYDLDSFNGKETRKITLKGNSFYSKDKSVLIIDYEDENGYKYTTEKSFLVNMSNLPLHIKFFDFFRNLFQ